MKKHLPLLLSGLSSLLLILGLFQISSLRNQVQNLESNLAAQSSQIQNSILNISGTVSSILEEKANLLNEFTLDYGDLHISQGTAEIHCRILPKTYTPASTQVSLLAGEQETPLTLQNGAYVGTVTLPLFQSTKISQVLLNDQGTIRAQALDWTASPMESLLRVSLSPLPSSASYAGHMEWSPTGLLISVPGDLSIQRLELVEVKNGKEIGRLPVKRSQKAQKAYQHKLSSTLPGHYIPSYAPAEAAGDPSASASLLYAFDKRYSLDPGDRLAIYLDLVDQQGVRYRWVANYASYSKEGEPDFEWEMALKPYQNGDLAVLFDETGKAVYQANPELIYAK